MMSDGSVGVVVRRVRTCVFQIEVILAVATFSGMLVGPLQYEYIYQRIAERVENASASSKSLSDCEGYNITQADKRVSQLVSRLTLFLGLTSGLPGAVIGVVLMSWSDRVGRKLVMMISIAGATASVVVTALVICFKWNLEVLFIGSALAGMTGTYYVFMMQGVAYLSDSISQDKKSIRFVVLEMCLGLGAAVGAFTGGYWVEAHGFLVPVVTSAAVMGSTVGMVALLPAPSTLACPDPDSRDDVDSEIEPLIPKSSAGCDVDRSYRKRVGCSRDDAAARNPVIDAKRGKPESTSICQLVSDVARVYTSEESKCSQCDMIKREREVHTADHHSEMTCEHGGGTREGRISTIWLYLVAYDFYSALVYGGGTVSTIYLLSKPLCFSPALIGIQQAIKFGLICLNPPVVLLFQKKLRLTCDAIIIIGFAAVITQLAILSFATVTWVVFLSIPCNLLYSSCKPLIQAQVSALVSTTEQGAAFAMLNFSDTLTNLVSSTLFLLVYSATLNIYHGFVWACAAGVGIIPVTCIIVIRLMDQHRRKKATYLASLRHNHVGDD